MTAEGERVLGTIPQDYTAAVGEIDTLKKSKAEIDDTVIDGDTWSSKHIVDMLCPKVEKSGTLVQMDGMLGGYPLGVKVSWKPTQEGSGEPSPENIRPIQGRDSVRIERCGKNLWSLGNVVFKQYKEISTNYPAGKYVLSCEVETEATSDTVQIGKCVDGKWVYTQEQKNKRIIILISASVGISAFRFYAGSSPTNNVNATYKNIQLELGNGATTYEPCTADTNTLTLPSTVYGGEVDAEGKGQETWELRTLNGTEDWIVPSSNNYYAFFGNPNSDESNGFCSHLPFTNKSGGKSAFANKNGAIVIYGYNNDYTLSEFKAYLAAQYAAGTPMQIAYKTVKSVPFTATGGAPIKALPGTNTILTDADSVTVTGRADPIQTIAKLSDRIAALEAAATNITE